jgi:hypothetical protein
MATGPTFTLRSVTATTLTHRACHHGLSIFDPAEPPLSPGPLTLTGEM